jgi:serine/threonine-protein kinase
MEVSPALEAVIEQALSWSPRRRFENTVQFAEELEAASPPAPRAEVAAWVESMAATRLAVQRKLLSAMDAPYGRISSPPPNARRFELGRSDSLAVRKSSSPPPPEREPKFAVRISALRSGIASAFRKSSPPDDAAIEEGGWWSAAVQRVKTTATQQGSTLLASMSLICLLLAATRATISRAHPPAMRAGAAIPVLPAGNGPIAGTGLGAVAEEACVPLPPSPAVLPAAPPLEPAPHVATLTPGAAPEPARREATDERDRRRATPRRPAAPERSSCDPPFIVDESGIRRIKPNCL